MDHGLMLGMFLGGVVMMTPPVLLGIGVGVYVWRQRRAAQRADARAATAND
jgi:hypothetical protein